MSEPLAYLNGRFLPQREAALPLHDAGFVFGATVTDLCRTFRHRLYRLDDHLARFRQSCQLAMVPQPLTDAALTEIAVRIVAENSRLLQPEADLALVMLATPGPVGFYAGLPGGPGDGAPTLAMHTFPLQFARFRRLFTEGARLVVPDVRQVPLTCVDPRIKHRSRLHWWIADREAQRAAPGASALLLYAPDSAVTETAAANFLLVKRGTVLSPPRSIILEGISLRTVEELCRELGIPFREEVFTLAETIAADEAMLANTSYCLAGVRRINDHIPLPWPGPIFEKLLAAWSQSVGLDIRAQILANG
jgi:D-alanine transaminase/branched-chain amino acid aminotransferase